MASTHQPLLRQRKKSASEKASIIEAIDQIANGEYLSNDDVDAEIDLWLNK